MKAPSRNVVLAFCAGLLAAVAVKGIWWAARGHMKGDPGRRHERVLARFQKQLDLDADQRAKIKDILRTKRDRTREAHDALRERYEEIRSSARSEIRALLEPAQARKFDQMTRRWDEKRRARRGRGGAKGRPALGP